MARETISLSEESSKAIAEGINAVVALNVDDVVAAQTLSTLIKGIVEKENSDQRMDKGVLTAEFVKGEEGNLLALVDMVLARRFNSLSIAVLKFVGQHGTEIDVSINVNKEGIQVQGIRRTRE